MDFNIADFFLCLFCSVFAVVVVFSKSPVVSAFSLLMSFMGFAGVYFRLGSVFLTTIQVLIYAGAIAIIFIFVLMLLNLDEVHFSVSKKSYGFISGVIALLTLFGLLVILIFNNTEYLSTDKLPQSTMNDLFTKLFNTYLVPFELTTVLLLGAIVAAVFVTKKRIS